MKAYLVATGVKGTAPASFEKSSRDARRQRNFITSPHLYLPPPSPLSSHSLISQSRDPKLIKPENGKKKIVG